MLIQRLVGRRQHFLALRIAEHLGLSVHSILVDWACKKVCLFSSIEYPS
jgi:hypothetical protein